MPKWPSLLGYHDLSCEVVAGLKAYKDEKGAYQKRVCSFFACPQKAVNR